MRPDLPWNVAGVPPEAREAARAAARREGLPVGEWLTRRILRSLTEIQSQRDAISLERQRDPADQAPQIRQDPSEPSSSEMDLGDALHRFEEQLDAFAHRVDVTERSQSECQRAISKATLEINTATRDQAQATERLHAGVAKIAQRVDRLEQQSVSDGLREAVRGLHQGLTRLADQVSQSSSHAASQTATLTHDIEILTRKLDQTKFDVDSLSRALASRDTHFEQRLTGVERRLETNSVDVARAAQSAVAIARLEESLARVESRGPDLSLDQRLNGIERTLGDMAARSVVPERSPLAPEQMQALAERIEATEKSQREATAELRNVLSTLSEPKDHVAPPIAETDAVRAPAVNVGLEAQRHLLETHDLPANAPPLPAVTGSIPSKFPVQEAQESPNPENFPSVSADSEEHSAPHESFLAAARRSAQAAAAQVEAERPNQSFSGFAWSTRAEPARRPARYGIIGLIVLATVLLALAALLFSQRLTVQTAYRIGTTGSAAEKVPSRKSSARRSPSFSAPSSALDAAAIHRQAGMSKPTARAGSVSLGQSPARGWDVEATGPARPASAAVPPPPLSGLRADPVSKVQLAALDRVTALANAGNARAETIVGLRYLDGTGVVANESEAAKWLIRAAAHGEAVAQYRLASLYERGHGVPTDSAKALHWYAAAAEAGNRKAMHNLAVDYAQGSGVPKDFFEAARWFSKAAALGLADSQFNLAVLYERGLGVPQSLLDAYKWYAIAAAQGDAESKSRIEAIATQLSADDRAAAQRSADQFKPAPMNATANVPPQLKDIAG